MDAQAARSRKKHAKSAKLRKAEERLAAKRASVSAVRESAKEYLLWRVASARKHLEEQQRARWGLWRSARRAQAHLSAQREARLYLRAEARRATRRCALVLLVEAGGASALDMLELEELEKLPSHGA